jgi:cyclophilin family peptidyl-prolyl cis-trans isomerase
VVFYVTSADAKIYCDYGLKMETRMHKRILALIVLLMAGLHVLPLAAQDASTPTDLCAAALPAADPDTREFAAPPPRVLADGVDYGAIFCTDVGAVYIDLLEDYAPLTVNNFVFLSQAGYYNNTTFHRVIQDFMAQGGDPTATGSGGPGYDFADEFMSYITFANPGILAMANAGPGTNGSQFFITTAPTAHLNYAHTIFGHIVEGADIVSSIRLRDPQVDTTPGTALETVLIITDPSSVATTAEASAPSTTTAEEIQTAFNQLVTDLPEGLIVDELDSGARTNDELVAAAPEAAREDYAAFLNNYGHAYRVGQALETTTCDLEALPFMAISAQVDAFADAASAQAALDDGFLDTLATVRGFTASTDTPATLTNTLYTLSGDICEVPSVQALTYARRGRFLVTYESITPVDSQFTPDQWLSEFVSRQIYDSLLGEIFVRELPWAQVAAP